MWAIYIGLIVAGLFLKGSKPYAIAVILFIGILAWNNTDAADYYSIYWRPYQNPTAFTGLEPGWRALCQMGGALGLSYNGFACILAVLSTAFLYMFAKGSGVNTSYFLALFLVYPGLISLVQFRQFVASSVVAVGLLLLKRDGTMKYVWYALVVLLAFTIHRSALIMLSLIFLPLIYRVKGRGRFIMGMIAAIIALFLIFNAEAFSSYFFGEYKTSAYLQKTESIAGAASRLGGIRNVVYLIGFAALTYYDYSLLKRDENGGNWFNEAYDFWHALVGSSLIMLMLVPFATIGNDFMRFQRYAFTYTNALFAIMPMLSKRDPIFSSKAVYVAVCFAFLYPFVIAGTFDDVMLSLLSLETFPPFFA